jgi:hypothetical protein
MDPITIATLAQAGLSILSTLIQEEPALAADFKAIFSGTSVQPADIEALIASLQQETYGKFVPASQLPSSETAS